MNQSAYAVIYMIANDKPFQSRITTCAYETAMELEPMEPFQPEDWTIENRYAWASTPGWAELVDEAMGEGIPNWNLNPNVIQDDEIKVVVRDLLNAQG